METHTYIFTDDAKDKRFSGSVRLPTAPKTKYDVCVLADAAHIEEAQKHNIAFMDVEALKNLKKSKKLIRKLCESLADFLNLLTPISFSFFF